MVFTAFSSLSQSVRASFARSPPAKQQSKGPIALDNLTSPGDSSEQETDGVARKPAAETKDVSRDVEQSNSRPSLDHARPSFPAETPLYDGSDDEDNRDDELGWQSTDTPRREREIEWMTESEEDASDSDTEEEEDFEQEEDTEDDDRMYEEDTAWNPSEEKRRWRPRGPGAPATKRSVKRRRVSAAPAASRGVAASAADDSAGTHSWSFFLHSLQSYRREEFGSGLISKFLVYKGVPLGHWVHSQATQLQLCRDGMANALTDEKYLMLEELLEDHLLEASSYTGKAPPARLDVQSSEWASAYLLLVEYKRDTDETRILGEVIFRGFPLGSWWKRQTEEYQKHTVGQPSALSKRQANVIRDHLRGCQAPVDGLDNRRLFPNGRRM